MFDVLNADFRFIKRTVWGRFKTKYEEPIACDEFNRVVTKYL